MEVSDGSIKLYVENTIAQNIHSQIGADSYSHTILDTISRTIRQSPNIKSLYWLALSIIDSVRQPWDVINYSSGNMVNNSVLLWSYSKNLNHLELLNFQRLVMLKTHINFCVCTLYLEEERLNHIGIKLKGNKGNI